MVSKTRLAGDGRALLVVWGLLLVACGGRSLGQGATALCGDGVRQGAEQCDGLDLGGATCGSLGLPDGALHCRADCRLDTSDCGGSPACGNGTREFGEECDCGLDPWDLPAGCAAINGQGGCSAQCTRVDLCGDGVVQLGEECDCGEDPWNLPAGCPGLNGDWTWNPYCTDACYWEEAVECFGHWEDCDPLQPASCCDDPWGVQLGCTPLPIAEGWNRCLRQCVNTNECYWHHWCLGPQLGDLCWLAICNPGGDIDAEMNATCQVPGGHSGWCWPTFERVDPLEHFYGVCMESGSLPHGSTCEGSQDLLSIDRSVAGCHLGFCRSVSGGVTGRCTQFCDWEAAYAVAIYGSAPITEPHPCPTGTNCFAESTVGLDGIRRGDVGYCVDTELTNPIDGMTTCSLVTNQLLKSPTQTCASVAVPNGICVMVAFDADVVTNGTLVGVCVPGPSLTALVWEPCDPATDTCEPGTHCVEQDAFASSPVGPTRCVPLCDTEHHDGVQASCQDLGAPASSGGVPVCTSQSRLYPPNGPLDIHPTRLGYCALPPP